MENKKYSISAFFPVYNDWGTIPTMALLAESALKKVAGEYEIIFYTDGDAQYNPLELEQLVEKMNDDVDIVNGYKISRQDPFYRKVIGRLYHYTTKIMFKFKIRDVDCDFRLIRRSLFDNLELKYNSGTICVEMISKFTARKARFVEVPVTHYYRVSGKSQFFNFKRIFKTGVHLIKLWYWVRIKKQY